MRFFVYKVVFNVFLIKPDNTLGTFFKCDGDTIIVPTYTGGALYGKTRKCLKLKGNGKVKTTEKVDCKLDPTLNLLHYKFKVCNQSGWIKNTPDIKLDVKGLGTDWDRRGIVFCFLLYTANGNMWDKAWIVGNQGFVGVVLLRYVCFTASVMKAPPYPSPYSEIRCSI